MRLLYSRTEVEAPGELSAAQLALVYGHPRPETTTAWLRTNFVTTLDGSITGLDGRSGTINTPSDQHLFALHRALCDAVVVGAGTVRAEGYRAVELDGWQRDLRAELGLAPFPVLVVVSASLNVDLAVAGDGTGGSVLVLTTDEHSADSVGRFTAAGIEVLGVGHPAVDLAAAVDQLAGLGYQRLLCEGGPGLHRDLLAADLVDDLSLTLAPSVVGGVGQRTTSGDALPEVRGFDLDSVLLGDDGALFTRYRRSNRQIDHSL